MLFKFRNIGKIAEADIEINGLTVLGGHNDTGKSTIGKTLYSIIKTIRNSEVGYYEIQIEQINNILSDLMVNIRKMTGISPHHKVDKSDSINKEKIIQILSVFVKNLKNYNRIDENIMAEVEILINQATQKVSEVFGDNINTFAKYKSVFTYNNDLLFRGDFINKKNPAIFGEIICNDFEKNLLKIIIQQDSIKEFYIIDNFIFEDVTLIESPIILNQSNYISIVYMMKRSVFLTYEYDLISKINSPKLDYYNRISDSQKIFMDQISNIIEGKVYYDEKMGDYIFKQNSELKIQSTNIASGIKSFGIIQLLITSGAINPNTLLIIDEPEVHLHPEWQLKYAELIAKLVDSGVYVLISSHSPYMIEALKVYSDKLKLDRITRFYVGNTHEKGTIFQDVTEDMEPLFHQLAFPMQKLTFEA